MMISDAAHSVDVISETPNAAHSVDVTSEATNATHSVNVNSKVPNATHSVGIQSMGYMLNPCDISEKFQPCAIDYWIEKSLSHEI